MQLRHLSVPELIAIANGDPWKLNGTIQSGSPGEIHELASAFHDAGECIGETDEEFSQAKRRFEEAWDRDDGGAHPINESAEVTRATTALRLDKEEVSRIAVDLEKVAASLAEAQKTGSSAIKKLEASLQQIDDAIDAAILENGLVVDEDALAPLKKRAIRDVSAALSTIGAARDMYGGELKRAMSSMQAEGYSPDAIDGADGDGVEAPSMARGEAADYNFQQRAADQALADSDGPMTPEKAAAAARLRDYGTIQDPSSAPDAVRLAGERLEDFRKSRMAPGILPPDPILGADPQRRALVRQEWQRQLEHGSPWMPPMTPDEATAWMNQQEAQATTGAINGTIEALQKQGIPRTEAEAIVNAASNGLKWSDMADAAGPLSEAKQADGALSDGKHALPWERYSPETIKTISNIGKTLNWAGSLLQVGVAVNEWHNGAPAGKTFGGLAGSLGGGIGGGALTGFLGGWAMGPPGAFVGAVAGGLAGGTWGMAGGEELGGLLDK